MLLNPFLAPILVHMLLDLGEGMVLWRSLNFTPLQKLIFLGRLKKMPFISSFMFARQTMAGSYYFHLVPKFVGSPLACYHS